tara:strand:+ start:2381 stop:3412 length:1032 start_codon:yes stop_codon:yes gene_type:complete
MKDPRGYQQMFDENDPRIVTIKGRGMIDYQAFGGIASSEALNIFGLRTHYTGDINEDNRCYDPQRVIVSNSKGYRGAKESDSQVDMIATGCSQTFGLGIDEENMWSRRMSDALGMSVTTIAASGWSVQEMVASVMHHIRKYGKPKVIAALLPDFGRSVNVKNETVMIPDEDAGEKQHNELEPRVRVQVRGFHYDAARGHPKLSKLPHIANDVVPYEWPVYASAQAWAAFVEYCHVADITLVWTSWDKPVLDCYSLLREMADIHHVNPEEVVIDTMGLVDNPYYFDGYGPTSSLTELSCHRELKDKWPDTFDVGSDLCTHYGVHAHVHIAEMLTNRYKELISIA